MNDSLTLFTLSLLVVVMNKASPWSKGFQHTKLLFLELSISKPAGTCSIASEFEHASHSMLLTYHKQLLLVLYCLVDWLFVIS